MDLKINEIKDNNDNTYCALVSFNFVKKDIIDIIQYYYIYIVRKHLKIRIIIFTNEFMSIVSAIQIVFLNPYFLIVIKKEEYVIKIHPICLWNDLPPKEFKLTH